MRNDLPAKRNLLLRRSLIVPQFYCLPSKNNFILEHARNCCLSTRLPQKIGGPKQRPLALCFITSHPPNVCIKLSAERLKTKKKSASYGS